MTVFHILLTFALALAASITQPGGPTFKTADIGHGIVLHYAEEGRGQPVIFVHGSLSDYGYWQDEVPAFAAAGYHAIAYSRRYNLPNHNSPVSGYSAITDADDLAAFIRKLGLHRVDVIGHSYGAYTALFLAARHPELVHKIVLAEPPAVPLLPAAMREDIRRRMIVPMQQAFRSGNREQGVAVFIDYVFGNPRAWQEMAPSARAATMADAHEWDVMMTRGSLFPQITQSQVHSIHAPVLILTGARTYPFLRVIDSRLKHLLPDAREVLLQRSGHQMWYQQTQDCRRATEEFLK